MLDNVMERLGKLIAADQSLDVKVQGSKAYSEPGKIVIPSLDQYEFLGENAERMLHGLLDHECGHAVDSDFKAVQAFAKQSPAHAAVINALEDGYVEARQGARYLGCQENLERKNRWAWEEGGGEFAPAKERIAAPGFEALATALTFAARPFGGQSIEAISEINPAVGEVLESCRPLLEELKGLADKPRASKDVIRLAQSVYQKIKEFSESNPPPPQPSKDGDPQEGGGGGGSGDSGSQAGAQAGSNEAGDGEEGDEKKSAAPTPGDGKGEEGKDKKPPKAKAGKGADGEKTSKAKKLASGMESWKGAKGPLSPEDAIHREIDYKMDKTNEYIVFSHEWDREVKVEVTSATRKKYDRMEEQTALASESLVSCFEHALRAKRAKRYVTGYDEGLIDVGALTQYAVGAASPDTIFCEAVADDDRDVAVALLVDCSGSMGSDAYEGGKSRMAALTAIAMHRALARVGVAHEVTGFTTYGYATGASREFAPSKFEELHASLCAWQDATRAAVAKGEKPERYGRFRAAPPIYPVFKDFDDVDPYGIAAITGCEENLDGEALLWQARRLAKRREPRRVMFVLSDGAPAGSDDNNQGAAFLKETVKRVTEAGIEVYGIGIQTSAVAQFYPQHWVCNDLNELTTLAMTVMTQALTEGRKEQRCVAW